MNITSAVWFILLLVFGVAALYVGIVSILNPGGQCTLRTNVIGAEIGVFSNTVCGSIDVVFGIFVLFVAIQILRGRFSLLTSQPSPQAKT